MISPILFSRLTDPFAKLWRGEHSLPKAFWLFFILGNFVLGPFIAIVVGAPFILLNQRQTIFFVFFVVGIIYAVFSAVGVWRSANMYLQNSPNVYAVKAIYVVGAKVVVCLVLWVHFQRATGITFMGLLHRLTSN